MAIEELSSPIPEIKPEDQPGIMAYSLLRNFVADLKSRQTTPGMSLWSELRFRYLGETNYPRWSTTFAINGEEHTIALYGVQGELPNGKKYSHSSLRCSCGLPDHKSYIDLYDEYHECPAKDIVISQRAKVYKRIVGGDEFREFDDESLLKATVFLLNLIQRDPLAWPPSDRSDRILVNPLAEVFGIPKERMRANAEELAQNKVVELRGQRHPNIALAA